MSLRSHLQSRSGCPPVPTKWRGIWSMDRASEDGGVQKLSADQLERHIDSHLAKRRHSLDFSSVECCLLLRFLPSWCCCCFLFAAQQMLFAGYKLLSRLFQSETKPLPSELYGLYPTSRISFAWNEREYQNTIRKEGNFILRGLWEFRCFIDYLKNDFFTLYTFSLNWNELFYYLEVVQKYIRIQYNMLPYDKFKSYITLTLLLSVVKYG